MPSSKTIGSGIGILALLAAALYAARSMASTPTDTLMLDPAASSDSGSSWLDWLAPTTPGATASDTIQQSQGTSSWLDFLTPNPSMDQIMTDTANSSTEQRTAALMAVIRKFESGNDYTKLYGGGHFSDFSQHPNIRVPFVNPRTGFNDVSTAAGAYQINFPTYTDFAGRLGISSFTPADQDAIAFAILQQTGAIRALNSGDVQTAFALASSRWASLPGSTSGQHQQSIQTAMAAFDAALATA